MSNENEIATLGTFANYAEGVDLTVNTLTIAQLWARAKTDADEWTRATLDADRAGMQVLFNCVTLKQTHKVKRPLGSIMATCLDTPATRKRIGVSKVTTEHLTGKKGVLSEDANARYYYSVATALDVIISRGAQVDAEVLKNAASDDRAAYFAAFRQLAAALKKNESVKLTGTLSAILDQCVMKDGDSIRAALKTPGSPYAALLPPPAAKPPEPARGDGDTESPDAEIVPTEMPSARYAPADAVDTEATDADAVDAKIAHREREHAAGTTLADMEEGIHAALTVALKSPTIQALADIASAIMLADARLNGQKVDAASFLRATLAEIPQERARSLADAEPTRIAAQVKTKRATK
jgi:hypothetical protein